MATRWMPRAPSAASMTMLGRERGGRVRFSLDVVLLLVVIVCWCFALPTAFDSETQIDDSFNVVSYLSAYGLVALALPLVVISGRLIWAQLPATFWWWLLLIWMLSSTFWSIDPKPTLFAAGPVAAVAVIIARIAPRLDYAVMSRIVAAVLIVIVIYCIALAVVAPQYGLMNTSKFEGQLRGFYSHKNRLSHYVSFMMLWVMCAYSVGCVSKRLAATAIALAGVALIWAWSATSLVIILLSAVMIFLLRAALRRGVSSAMLWYLILAAALLSAVLMPYLIGSVIDIFGKDATFSGRDVLWQAYLELASRRPLIGYGYMGLASAALGAGIVWDGGNVPSAHNIFIQTYADLGAPAALLLIFCLVKLFIDGVSELGRGQPQGVFKVVFIFAYALEGMTEVLGGLSTSIGLILTLYMAFRPRRLPAVLPGETPGPTTGGSATREVGA